jgi:hypothetical protein
VTVSNHNMRRESRIYKLIERIWDRLCGLVVEFLATDPQDPGSILGATRFSEK